MNYDVVSKQFGKWAPKFRKFIESKDMDELFSYIKSRAQSGVKVLPDAVNVFRAFAETDPDNLKCIICGIGPYHTTYEVDKKKVSIADGLALSCSSTWKVKGLQPSIEQIYASWENDYCGFDPDMEMTGDLSYLSKQGVLLYNIALTVEENKPLSMNSQWSKFNQYMWQEVINVWFRGIPVLFMGEQAHKSANLLTPMLHYPICVPHPASASYKNTVWSSEGCWQKVDKILWDNNKQVIQWYKKTGDSQPMPKEVQQWINGSEDDTVGSLPWQK